MFNKFNHFFIDDDHKSLNITDDSVPWVLISILKKYNNLLFLCHNNSELFSLSEKLKILVPNLKIFLFPEWDSPLFSNISPTNINKSLRIEALSNVVNEKISNTIFLTTPTAMLFKTIPKLILKGRTLNISENSKNINLENIKNFFLHGNYNRVETVRQKNEYSIRGGIIDFFSSSENFPIRLDTFGSEIDDIKTFDPISQLSLKKVKETKLIPSSEVLLNKESIENFRVKFRDLKIKNSDEIYNSISEGITVDGIEQFLPLFYDKLEDSYSYFEKLNLVIRPNFNDDIIESERKILRNFFSSEIKIDKNAFLTRSDYLIKKISMSKSLAISSLVNLEKKKDFTQ